jgi:hypothetical protein
MTSWRGQNYSLVGISRILTTQQPNEAFSASVIEHLKNTGNPLAFFDFDFRSREEQDYHEFVVFLIVQLAQYSVPPTSLREVYQELRREPTISELETMLHSICYSHTHPYIVLDAYDECSNHMQYFVLDLIQRLRAQHELRILIFTRPGLNPGVRSALRDDAEYLVDFEEEKLHLERDIREYLRQRVELDRQLHRWDPGTSQIVIDQLAADSSKG